MTDRCSRILYVFFFHYCCPKFRLLLWFFTIVTISRLKMLYFEPFSVFYHDFILLTCILWQPVRLVGLVVLFLSRSWIFVVGSECDWSLVVSRSWNLDFCMDFCFIRLFYGWYDWLCGSYCYLFVNYLLSAVLDFYSVFVTISTIGCVGRYLSFPF